MQGYYLFGNSEFKSKEDRWELGADWITHFLLIGVCKMLENKFHKLNVQES